MNGKIARFNKLEDLKKKEVEFLEWALEEQKKVKEGIKEYLSSLKQERTKMLAEFGLKNNDVFDIDELWDIRKEIELLDEKTTYASSELKKCEAMVENIMKELLNKHKEAKVMEKAANRLVEREKSEQLANEQAVLDDISQSRYGRNDVL